MIISCSEKFRDGSPLSDATSASPIALARGVVVRFLPQAVSYQVQVLVTEKLPATFMVLNLAPARSFCLFPRSAAPSWELCNSIPLRCRRFAPERRKNM